MIRFETNVFGVPLDELKKCGFSL